MIKSDNVAHIYNESQNAWKDIKSYKWLKVGESACGKDFIDKTDKS